MDAIFRGPCPAAGHPDAGEPVVAHALELEGRQRPDERLLEVAHVALDVLPVLAEIEDRVADELARAVERRLAAAVGLGDLDVRVLGDVELARRLRAAADRHDRRVLEEDDGLRDRALRDGAGERPLQLERLAVRDEAEVHEIRATRHRCWNIQRCPSGSSAV